MQLSLESTSQRSLQLVANLVGDSSIPTRDIPIVPRSHDDLFLRPADERVGERPCCLGERCICRFIALMRYGEESPLKFVGREFLLPDEHTEFLASGKLPAQPGKCLLCLRYLHVRPPAVSTRRRAFPQMATVLETTLRTSRFFCDN